MVSYPDTWPYRHVPCLTPSHSWSSEIIWELFLLFRSDLCLHCWSLPFMKTSKIKLACFYFPRSSSHIKILITATTHPCRCAKCYNSGNCNINIFGGHFFLKNIMYSLFFFFFFWSCRHGSGFFKLWELLTLLPRYKRYKTQPHWGGYSAHHKAQAGIMKDNLEEKAPLWPPGYLWSETQTFKGWSLLEAASSEIFLVLAHLIFESSGQLCRTSQKPSRDIGRRVRSFSGRNSHMCLNGKTKPRCGRCEEWVVNTVEPC